VKDATGLLDDIVVNPLLAVAVEAWRSHGGSLPVVGSGVSAWIGASSAPMTTVGVEVTREGRLGMGGPVQGRQK
jgi:hypothetical protein